MGIDPEAEAFCDGTAVLEILELNVEMIDDIEDGDIELGAEVTGRALDAESLEPEIVAVDEKGWLAEL